jgi:Zn-dependent peptidase ImmA (M78 family)/DNA-binding transcriptional regulator YiaG
VAKKPTDASPAPRPAVVSPASLAWARQRSDLSTAEVARRLKRRTITSTTIEQWERGTATPTPAQLSALAEIYRIPERWLRYPDPPRHFDDLGLVDFRTPTLTKVGVLSQNLRSALEHSLAVQAWVVSHRAREKFSPVELVGCKQPGTSATRIADHLRTVLDLESLRETAEDADDFFKLTRQKIESMGILVLRMGQVANKTRWPLDPNEFKGFTLIDEDRFAPLIFINRKDLADAHIFTLFHELTHIVTGGAGVSNEDIDNIDDHPSDIERLCDDVAEELLVPRAGFDAVWHRKLKSADTEIDDVAKLFKVPSLVAGRRATSLERLPRRSFRAQVEASRKASAKRSRKGGNSLISIPSWYGEDLVCLLAASATSDDPSGSDALELLGASFETARKLARPRGGKEVATTLPRMKPFDLIPIENIIGAREA